jgi:hypothetical protein
MNFVSYMNNGICDSVTEVLISIATTHYHHQQTTIKASEG